VNTITCEIISTGTEILQGLYPDTNAQIISRRFKDLGIPVQYHTAVGDDKDTLAFALKIARYRSDIIVMTGGLGPTEDDLTREVVARLYDRVLKKDEKAEQMICEHFTRRRIPMPESNLIQAMVPEGCIPLYNFPGTAPGFIIHEKERKKALIALPGPQREWMPMFESTVTEFLKAWFPTDMYIETLTLRTINIPESKINEQISPLFGAITGVTLGLLAKPGKVDIRATACASTREETHDLLQSARKKILACIDTQSVYAEKEDASIEETVARLLANQGQTLGVAESCTGGLVSKRLTDIPGSSAYFKEGIIAYSNEAKIKYLGVRERIINQYGAVSGEVASEMASGMKRISGADLAVSITGIAGPSGGTPAKPVGLVYFGLATKDHVSTWERRFTGDREMIRERAADFALDILRRGLLKSPELYRYESKE